MPVSKGRRDGEATYRKGDKALGLEWTSLLPRNPTRKGCTVFNPSNATVWLDFGKAQGASCMVALPPGGLWESPYPCSEPLMGKASIVASTVYVRDFS
jgi:hypothetical protein